MESLYVFIFILVIVFVLLNVSKMYETYVSGSFDITPGITVDMDWKGSQVSTYPYYPNNLTNAPQNITTQIKKLQSYQSESDGPTGTDYVSMNIKNQKNIDNVNNLEGFTMMNPFVSEH